MRGPAWRRWRRRTTASPSPRRTCSSGAAATCSACARPACPGCALPTWPAPLGCWSLLVPRRRSYWRPPRSCACPPTSLCGARSTPAGPPPPSSEKRRAEVTSQGPDDQMNAESDTQSTDGTAPPHRSTWWTWPAAGLLAGTVVGAFDTIWAVSRGVGGLAPGKGAVLILLGISWTGVAALMVGMIIAALAAVLTRSRGRAWLPEAVLALAALPVLGYAAFAAFRGHRAASVPAHQALSLLLALLGTAAVFVAAGGLRRLLARLDAGRGPSGPGLVVLVVGLAALAAASELANQLQQ